MQIVRSDKYIYELDILIDFIAQDSFGGAKRFLKQLDITINTLTSMPYRFRQSQYYENPNVRDLIFKGYTIPYLIDNDKEPLVVLDIFKWSQR